MSLILHAPNVHEGGGRTLLLALFEALDNRDDVTAIVDARLPLPRQLPSSRIALRVQPSVTGRLAAEWRLRRLAGPGSVVLCLGNLPPLLGARGRVVLFLQNRLLLRGHGLPGLPLRIRLRLFVERRWLRMRLPSVHEVVVQGPAMSREVERELGRRAIVAPFTGEAAPHARRAGTPTPAPRREFDFLYVASGEPHKNHETLIAAWELLAAEGLFPSLCLTVDPARHPDLHAHVERARTEHRLKIHNLDAAAGGVAALYGRSSALIYPSLVESLGLPLIEARAAGLPIVAAELDYVRDVVDPEETFEAGSPVSMARAVKRFLGREEPAPRIASAAEFLQRLSSGFAARQ